jgi:hypothetical protein
VIPLPLHIFWAMPSCAISSTSCKTNNIPVYIGKQYRYMAASLLREEQRGLLIIQRFSLRRICCVNKQDKHLRFYADCSMKIFCWLNTKEGVLDRPIFISG